MKKKHPEFGHFMKPDIDDMNSPEKEKTELGKARFQSPADKKSSVEDSRDYGGSVTSEKLVMSITMYERDDEIEEEKGKDEEGKTVFTQKKKFPKGRVTKVIGGVLVEDKEYPYDDYEKRFAPYARLQNYILPREFFGISEIEQLRSPQRIFNKLISFSLDCLTLMGNPVWVVDTASGVDTDNLVNRPGLVIEKNPGSEVRREEGTQLQPYVLALIDRMQSWFNDVSGSTDITRGKAPEGVKAARAIVALQDASHTRLRLKSRLIDQFLQDLGQMYCSRVFQFYTAPMIFRITEDEESFKYFKMSVEPGENDTKKVNITRVEETPEGVTEGPVESIETSGKFDVIVTTGSSLPFAKEERFAEAKDLLQLGIIDAEEVLNAVDYPNKERVLERLRQREEQAAIAQAQQPQ
jgi:hypothetical protein